jgi:hypothetical protein
MSIDKIDEKTVFTNNNSIEEESILFEYSDFIANNNIGIILRDDKMKHYNLLLLSAFSSLRDILRY